MPKTQEIPSPYIDGPFMASIKALYRRELEKLIPAIIIVSRERDLKSALKFFLNSISFKNGCIRADQCARSNDAGGREFNCMIGIKSGFLDSLLHRISPVFEKLMPWLRAFGA